MGDQDAEMTVKPPVALKAFPVHLRERYLPVHPGAPESFRCQRQGRVFIPVEIIDSPGLQRPHGIGNPRIITSVASSSSNSRSAWDNAMNGRISGRTPCPAWMATAIWGRSKDICQANPPSGSCPERVPVCRIRSSSSGSQGSVIQSPLTDIFSFRFPTAGPTGLASCCFHCFLCRKADMIVIPIRDDPGGKPLCPASPKAVAAEGRSHDLVD